VSARGVTEPELPAERLRAEVLTRARAAGHPPESLRAFAEAVAHLDEAALWQAVTLVPRAAAALDISGRLAAELDPLTAWSLNRAHADEDALGLPTRGSARPRILVGAEEDRELSLTGAKRLSARDLGESPAPPSGRHARPAQAPSLADAPTGPSGRFARPGEPLAAQQAPSSRHVAPPAARLLGVAHRRVAAGPAFPTGRMMELLVEALLEGLPVEAQLSGPSATGRGIFLQAREAGSGHALQLHVPATGETAWFNAQDLRDGAALPILGRRVCALVELLLPGRREDA